MNNYYLYLTPVQITNRNTDRQIYTTVAHALIHSVIKMGINCHDEYDLSKIMFRE